MTDYQVYLTMAGVATVVFLVKTVLMLIGADVDFEDADLDFDGVDGDSTDSFNIFSTQSVLAFFMLFGWSALAFSNEFGLGKLATIFGATSAGIVGMFVSAYSMKLVRKLNSKPLPKVPMVGTHGKVYIASRNPSLPLIVTVEHNGAPREFKAISPTALRPNTPIEVTGYEGNYLTVQPLNGGN